MTIEDRLRDALREADQVEPSVDLFERLTLSLEEDRARRRRLVTAIGATVLCLALMSAYSLWAFGESSGTVMGWKVVIPQLAISAVLIVALGPNIRRFAAGFVDDVFHLTPETGRRFLAVLDIAYYLTFTGLVLVDADVWHLSMEMPVASLLEASARRVAFLLLAMGMLHAVNIASLPILGLVYNSVARAHLRRTRTVPPEMPSARTADRNARAFAIGVVVTLLAVVAGLVMGPLAGWLGLFMGD